MECYICGKTRELINCTNCGKSVCDHHRTLEGAKWVCDNCTAIARLAEFFSYTRNELFEKYPFLRTLENYRHREILRMFEDYYELLVEDGAFGPGA